MLEKIICNFVDRRKIFEKKKLRIQDQLPYIIFAVLSDGIEGKYKLFLVFVHVCMSIVIVITDLLPCNLP